MIFTAPSQIALRQIEYFADKHVLVAGELEDDFPSELVNHCASVSIFTTNYGYYHSHKASKQIQTFFGAELTQSSEADLILLYWPKAKAEADFLLTMLLAKLGKGTEICVVGENRSGVKSIEKMFAPFGPITKYDSARRCSFYWGQCTQEAPTFELANYFKSYVVSVAEQEIQVRSLPGVFSHGEFDKGSQLLVESLPTLKGKVLDFGCGAGVLGSVMKILNPAIDINLCDISALAIESSKATLEANNLQGNVFATDVYSDTDNNYDYLISNPPFHAGLKTHYSSTETLLSEAPKHLKYNGQLLIVANSFLQYPPIIQSAFGHCETKAKTNAFKIYSAKKQS